MIRAVAGDILQRGNKLTSNIDQQVTKIGAVSRRQADFPRTVLGGWIGRNLF
jgi:hypothetical protein